MAPVGIGADRYETGSILRHEFAADLILLDDGFQHVKLARDVDVLLIDGVNPFGGGEVFPVGRLREPIDGMARADVIVMTRSDVTDLSPVIERVIRHHNPAAPILYARIRPEGWVENRTGRFFELDEIAIDRPGAFCGLGNPQGFRRTLEGMGVNLIDWIVFEDHHRYTPGELRHISAQFRARGVTAILTTEKDSVNLCETGDDQLAPLPLYWLRVSMRFDDEDVLMEAITRKAAGVYSKRA